MHYDYIIDNESRSVTFRVYGSIGGDIDANVLANTIAEVDDYGNVDTIIIRINSGGGNVIDGMSIVSVLRSCKAATACYVDGIAASMAAVIAVAADKLYMMDYAKIMIHDPYYAGGGKLSPKERKALDNIKDMLKRVLSRKGIDQKEISTMMEQETWFSAEEALEKKLCDGIVESNRKNELSGLTTDKLMALINNEYQPNIDDMKEIAKALGLPDNATEQQIIDKINELNNEQTRWRDQVINRMIASWEKSGIVTDKNKDRMMRLAKADFDLFCDMMESEATKATGKTEPPVVKIETVRLSQAIATLNDGKPANKSAKTWAWYQQNDPAYLDRLEKENPEEFNRLLDEYENSL